MNDLQLYLEASHHGAQHGAGLHHAEVGCRRGARGSDRGACDGRREGAGVVRDARNVGDGVAQLHVVADVPNRLERKLGEVARRLVHLAAAANSCSIVNLINGFGRLVHIGD